MIKESPEGVKKFDTKDLVKRSPSLGALNTLILFHLGTIKSHVYTPLKSAVNVPLTKSESTALRARMSEFDIATVRQS